MRRSPLKTSKDVEHSRVGGKKKLRLEVDCYQIVETTDTAHEFH